MRTNRYPKWENAGLLLAGALILCAPAAAQRSRGGTDSRSESRSESRPASREDSKPASRSDARPSTRNDSSGGSSRWQPSTPAYRGPAPSAPSVGNRNGSDTFRPTAPTFGNRGGTDTFRPSTPNTGGRFSPSPVPTQQRGNTPGNAPMGWRGNADTRTPVSPNTGGRFSADPVPTNRTPAADPAPSGRIGSGRSRGEVARPGSESMPDRTPRGTVNPPAAPTRPGGTTGDNTGGRWSGGSTRGTSGSRPGATNGTRDGDIGDGTTTPPTSTWRAPDRGRGSGPSRPGGTSSPGSLNRPGGVNTPANRPGHMGTKPVYISPTHRTRPPRIDRDRWLDAGRHFGGRNWAVVPLGFYDPWAMYRSSSPWFTDVRFYYPYYYIGPYYSGYYYSPFHMYGSWFPTWIYPERVVYIERRIYIRDYVDDDYYDPYDNTAQISLRDTMEDLKSAWLYGEGGRLLQHVNAAVPVRIYQRGVYKYSLEPEDYRDITKDALNRVETIAFEWVKIDQKRSDEVELIAKHTFRDPDGERQSIRLSYTLEKARGSWWITETGTAAWAGDI